MKEQKLKPCPLCRRKPNNNAEFVSLKPFVDEILRCLIDARRHLDAESHVKADAHLSAAQRIANIVSTLLQNGDQ